jgi:DNA-binding XRE family transcriptional regulator
MMVMPQVSPIGQAVVDHIQEALSSEPALRAEFERVEPYYDAAFAVMMLRAHHGVTQEELAHRIGTTKSAISRLERGRHKPNLDTLNRIARAFGQRLVIRFEDVGEASATAAQAASR